MYEYTEADAFVTIILVVACVVALIALGLYCTYILFKDYIYNRWFAREKTVQAIVYQKRQDSSSMTDVNVTSFIGDGVFGSFWSTVWDWFLGLIRYDQWKPGWTDNKYRIIFSVQGRSLELSVPSAVYIDLLEGQPCILTYKGNQFIGYKILSRTDQYSGSINLDNH